MRFLNKAMDEVTQSAKLFTPTAPRIPVQIDSWTYEGKTHYEDVSLLELTRKQAQASVLASLGTLAADKSKWGVFVDSENAVDLPYPYDTLQDDAIGLLTETLNRMSDQYQQNYQSLLKVRSYLRCSADLRDRRSVLEKVADEIGSLLGKA
jgi:hypothetical protein